MPVLYYAPMIHTSQELGSLKDAFLAAQAKECGEKKAQERLEETKRYWQEVERRIERSGLHLPEIASQLHIFIDSLPNTEEVLVKKIVEELTLQKIPVYLIIKNKKLQENGAVIHGTEDPELLLQEYHYWTGVSQGRISDPATAQKLLQDRDQAIARRIAETVPDEERALLFIGRAHDVISELHKLPRKFKVNYLEGEN